MRIGLNARSPSFKSEDDDVKHRIELWSWLAALLLFAISPMAAAGQTNCEDLSKISLANAKITSSVAVAAGAFNAPPLRTLQLPAFCRVAGIATPTSDSEIKFEVWLPLLGWNGKFEQVGNGGFAGAIPFGNMAAPLLRGYATAGTDDGHEGSSTDASWAAGHPEKMIDYGYRAVHETSVQAKVLVKAFYGRAPGHSYFVGCSDGGREALDEAEKYPKDFIGIISGAPANYLTRLLVGSVWVQQATGNDPASAIPPTKLPVLQEAAVAQCDTLDGVKDGIIGYPRLCKFDPATVQCKGADSPDCLTKEQVATAKKIYEGPKNPRTGEQLFPGYEPGTEALPGGWTAWLTGGNGRTPNVNSFAQTFFSNIVYANPNWDFKTFNFDSDVKLTDEKGALFNSNSTDLTAFKTRGGKLIQFHGWQDPAVPPLISIEFFEAVQKRMAPNGGDTGDFYRLFVVPGMSHCGGGLGATDFGAAMPAPIADASHDIVLSLDRWVEEGVAPEKLIATGTVPDDPAKTKMTRPLCPYPQEAQYTGTGDANDATNFVCRAPQRSK
jgi:hypothetical protein